MADDAKDTAAADTPVEAQPAAPKVERRPMGIVRMVLLGLCAVALAGGAGFIVLRSLDEPPTAPPHIRLPANADLATVEAAVLRTPDDTQAWVRLGDARMAAQEFQQAAEAYRRASELSPAVASIWSAQGEALVMAAPRNGPPISGAALTALRRALELDPKDGRARYFLAAKRDIDGDHAGAIDDWLALLADTPPGTPWADTVRQTIERTGARNGINVADRLAAVRHTRR